MSNARSFEQASAGVFRPRDVTLPQPFYHSLGEAAHCYTAEFLSVPLQGGAGHRISRQQRCELSQVSDVHEGLFTPYKYVRRIVWM